MAFIKKIWSDRVAQYTNRYTKTDISSTEVELTRKWGTVTTEGDQLNATALNDLENRIYNSSRFFDTTVRTIQTTDWVATPNDDIFYGTAACTYKADIAITGITSNYSADVIFHPADSTAILPLSLVTTCLSGAVRLYSSEVPSEPIRVIQISYIKGA